MADWDSAVLDNNTSYLDILDEIKARLEDVALMQAPTNAPTGYVKFTSDRFSVHTGGGTYAVIPIAITGGGTGAVDAATARTNLGLGSMATQNASAVNITGGTISGITLDAGTITTGTVALLRGGTGASLALGAAGTVMMSFGGAVAFRSGADIANLSASNLTSGTVPDGRLGATYTSFAANTINAANLGVSTSALFSLSCSIIGDSVLNLDSVTVHPTCTSGAADVSICDGYVRIRVNGVVKKIAVYAD